MRLFANANYDFIRRGRAAFTLSGAILGLLLVTGLFWQFSGGSWLNYGVDFTGGTLVQVQFTEQVSVADLREIVEPVMPGAEITRFGGETEFLIRAPQFSEDGANVAEAVVQTLETKYADGAFEVIRTEAVGPKVGGELQQKAVIAILLSFAMILVYLAFRFEWRYGVAAVIATGHDILATIGIISALQLEVSLPTVAAVLTVLGYSLNDKIIVFDRARENVKEMGRRVGLPEILNRSINETLPRTVLTSGTTLTTLLALFVIGGSTLRDFAFILALGVVIGTYSSICIASPTLLKIEERWKRQDSGAGKKGRPAPAGAGV